MTRNKKAKVTELATQAEDSGLPVLGYMVWWSFSGVNIERDELEQLFKTNNIDTKLMGKPLGKPNAF